MYYDKDQDNCVSYRFQHCEIKNNNNKNPIKLDGPLLIFMENFIGLFIHPPVYKETERSCL